MKTIINKLKGSGDVSKAFSNSSWLMLEKALTMPLGLVLSILLARHLGVEQLGKYSYLLSLVALIGPIGAMGLSSLITRELINHPEKEHRLLGASFIARMLGGVIGLLCLCVYAQWQDGDEVVWLSLLAVSQLFNAFSVIDFWFQSRVEVKYSVFSRLAAIVTLFGLRVGAVLLDASLGLFIWLYAMEQVLVGLMYVLTYSIKGQKLLDWQIDFNTAGSLLKRSYWLIFSGFAAIIYLRIDMVMLNQLIGDQATGLYAVASRVSEIWYFIPAALVSSFFPLLLKVRLSSYQQYQNKLQKLCDGLFVLSLSIILPVVLLAEFFIVLLFGEDFTESAQILEVHIFAGLFIFMRALLSKWLIAEELFKFSLVSQGMGAVVNVALNLWLIPQYGAIGAAWATLLSYASASYGALFFSSQTRPFAYIMTRSFLLPLRLVKLGR
ncbi:flippase [Lacimicrobium sp. SS2-24]|uniref:flippase n=1 Tax=Lacimicrobium sp. SS2-24 TaxID=2005569 RepID=UPI000B4B67C7|nr:flippase [Lacimicrobium sp. SS2-24]